MPLLNVGLTGGIAAGKTTVLRMLSECGLSTLSADEVAREVLEEPAMQEAVGRELRVRLPLDRKELGTIVANDPTKRRRLNALLHEEVFARIVESGADVVEVPLLVEACLQSSFRQVWVASCGPQEQLRRLTARLGDAGKAVLSLDSQLRSEVKEAFADVTVRTDGPLDAVQKEVVELARKLQSS